MVENKIINPRITILTGPPGSGKTTIGKILANKIDNSAVVSTDSLRYFVKNGCAEIGKGEEWKNQLRLGAENACLLSKNFVKNGFNVFLDDVICVKERMDIYKESLEGFEVKFILLMPKKEILLKRDLERGDWAMKERAGYLHDKFTEFIKEEKCFIKIDNTNQNAKETAEEIILRLNDLAERD
jgi:chloramphenicol 3-O-phosphotransferase